MKKILHLTLLFVMIVLMQQASFAQAPQSFKYQSVARNSSGLPIASANIGLRINVHDLSATGTVVYRETHTAATNAFGVFTVSVGGGSVVSGNFSAIAWGSGAKYIEVEADFAGGSSYVSMGTSQLMSVPYALYSENGTPGPQGPIGLTGAQGPIGLTGAAGNNGTDGAAGPQGPIGLTGITGPQGIAGNDGAVGATGPQGAIGLTGATGPQGIPGNDGAAGATGAQGPIGLTGAAGANGTNGSDGATGTTGAQGPIGLTGTQGPQGIPGNDGAAGATGAQGPIGLTGAAGANGTNGSDGATGVTGPQGPIGLTGATGAQGPIGLTGAAGNDGLTTSVNGVTQVAGAITLTKSNIGLDNVDNTTDANKPVSAATQTALDLKAPLASPTFTGTVVANTIQLTGGTPASGKVLTSDATGVATWQIAGGGGGWGLTGSAGTVDGTNFIGTTDDVPLTFKVFNSNAGRIESNNATANTFLGSQSGVHNTVGYFNDAFGYQALFSNETGNVNTSIGHRALFSNITGSYNTAIGALADVGPTDLINATAIGSGAIVQESNAIQLGNNAVTQIFAGISSNATLIAGGLKITGGAPEVGKVLTSDATGVATWQEAPGVNTPGGPWTIMIGADQAARIEKFPISGTGNTFYGYRSGNINNGTNNTANGAIALGLNTTGNYNTANGYRALLANTTGNNNTALGSFANVSIGTLTNATALGANAIVNADNTIQLGNSTVTQVFAGTGTTATLIAGGLQVTGGTPAAGKVLTSDATGVATWTTPSSIPAGTTAGQMLYWNGSAWTTLAPGANGQTLSFCNGVPTWGGCFQLTVNKTGAGSGTITSNIVGINCPGDCSEFYGVGTLVTLTQTPAPGSSFGGWSGGPCAGTGTCTVTLNSALTITAPFN